MLGQLSQLQKQLSMALKEDPISFIKLAQRRKRVVVDADPLRIFSKSNLSRSDKSRISMILKFSDLSNFEFFLRIISCFGQENMIPTPSDAGQTL